MDNEHIIIPKQPDLDILLVSIPRLSVEVPPSSIAILKPNLINAGFTCKCLDINIELYHEFTFEEWLEIDNYFQTDLRYTGNDTSGKQREIDFETMHVNKKEGLKVYKKYMDFLDRWTNIMLAKKPRWIGISVFSVNSVLSSIDVCKMLRKKSPNTKILLGGMGVSAFGVATRPNFGEYMKEVDLCDQYISGEGEKAIVDIIKTEQPVFFNPQLDNLNDLPYADYGDFDFDKYPSENNLIYTTGSRGCVRSCTFCDIGNLWEKFRYRSGENIAQEMLKAYEDYGTTEFYFTDSLINGNVKEFMDLCERLVYYKGNNRLPKEVSFGGQWICRPVKQFLEPRYQLASEAGLYNLSIGMESGSDDVLASMTKGVIQEDYDYQMEMLYKYGIRCNFLMIIGYPTETLKDFQATLDMFTRYKKYSDAGIVWGVNLGKTLVVLPGAPLGENPDHYGIDFDQKGNWINKDIGLDYNERVRRRMVVQRHIESLGYVVKSTVTTINSLHEIVKSGGYDSIE